MMPSLLFRRLFVLISVVAACALGTPGHAAARAVSLNRILAAPPSAWDNPSFGLSRWDRFPSICIVDTIDFHFQDRMFSRLAFFLEKRGFRGRLLGNAELEAMHGWNAHDYGPQGLASFFNAAQRTGFALNPEEMTLLSLLLDEGVLTTVRDLFAPGKGGILSISRSSSPIERRFLLTHESFHGIFFASPEYRAFCFHLWDSLGPRERTFFARFLDELGYDGESRYLAVNEFQAYLMQQPARFAPAYFERVAARFGGAGGTAPGTQILAAACRLDAFLGSRFGIHAGETLSVAPVTASTR